MVKVLLEMLVTLLCNEGKVLFGACKIVVTRKKCFWELARLLQRGKKWFLAFARLLQAFPKALWLLQCSIKDILLG